MPSEANGLPGNHIDTDAGLFFLSNETLDNSHGHICSWHGISGIHLYPAGNINPKDLSRIGVRENIYLQEGQFIK